jgi:hypothetical protein
MQAWLEERKDIEVDLRDVMDKAAIALKWLKEDATMTKRIPGYREVIELCLQCSFTPPLRAKTLLDADFQEAVYRDIVCKLESIYKISQPPVVNHHNSSRLQGFY